MSRGKVMMVALIAAAAVLSCQAQEGNGPFTCTSNADCAVEYTNQNGLACNPANQLCWVPPAQELPCGIEFCPVELCNECNGVTATFMCNDAWYVGGRNGTCQTVCTPTQAVDVQPTVLLAPYDTDAAVVNLEERELTVLEYEDRRVIYTGLVNKTFEETELQPVKVLVSELVLQEVVEKDFTVTQVAVNTTQITESCEPVNEGSEELACEQEEAIVVVMLPYMNITNVTREVLLPIMVEKEYTVPVTVEKTYLIAEERDEFVKMPVLRTRTVELASQGQRTVTLQAPQNSTHSRDITVPMCCACTVDPKDHPVTTNPVAAQTAFP